LCRESFDSPNPASLEKGPEVGLADAELLPEPKRSEFAFSDPSANSLAVDAAKFCDLLNREEFLTMHG
jgi:hypothetical protein